MELTLTMMEDLLKLATQYKLSYIRFRDFSAQLEKQVDQPVQETIPSMPQPTEDELLYWSSGYDPKENQEVETTNPEYIRS